MSYKKTRRNSRKGQTSMIDFLLGFLIFIVVAVLVSRIAFNNFQEDKFEQKKDSAMRVSEALISQGNPTNWTNQTVIKIGLTTNNRLDINKLVEYTKINYSETLSYLGVRDNYIFYFKKNGVINLTDVLGGNLTNNVTNTNGCIFGKVELFDGCEPNFDSKQIDATNIATVKRLLVYNSSIVQLVIDTW